MNAQILLYLCKSYLDGSSYSRLFLILLVNSFIDVCLLAPCVHDLTCVLRLILHTIYITLVVEIVSKTMEPPRQPRDMQGLLRFAIEGTASEDRTTTTSMSEERRRWLEEALRGLSVDVVAEISKSLNVLNPDRVESPEEDPQEMEEALEMITDFADSMDTANGMRYLFLLIE